MQENSTVKYLKFQLFLWIPDQSAGTFRFDFKTNWDDRQTKLDYACRISAVPR